MVIKFLYIDDEAKSSLASLTDLVEGDATSGSLSIQYSNPPTNDPSLDSLIGMLDGFDGLILDWRLDTVPSGQKRFNFRAGSVAQEIRIREAEGKLPSIPIVLWSTIDKLQGSYTGDSSSHDLFDLKQEKSKIHERADQHRTELLSLSIGYQKISAAISAGAAFGTSFLETPQEFLNFLPRSFTEFLKQFSDRSSHEYARFILKQLIFRPGVLIDEDRLAAKLGIDKAESADWVKLIALLDGYRYTGPFYDGWGRWWWPPIQDKWWAEVGSEGGRLDRLSASERTALLIDHCKLSNLKAATPILEGYDSKFQTICEVYRTPLDPVDGVPIKEPEPYMWQERRYLSLDAALKRLGNEVDRRPHPAEVERLEEIKKSLQA